MVTVKVRVSATPGVTGSKRSASGERAMAGVGVGAMVIYFVSVSALPLSSVTLRFTEKLPAAA